jgi:xanthosine utilization system XapX-like protein
MHSRISHAAMSVNIIGIIGMPVGLNNKFIIKDLIEGTCYIVMYRKIQCNQKLNAACLLQPCIAGSLIGCPSAPLKHPGMPVGLTNKFAIEGPIDAACYILRYRDTME